MDEIYTPFEFFNLPYYLQRQIILEELDSESIENLCEAALLSESKKAKEFFSNFCKNSEIWRFKIQYEFPSYFREIDRRPFNSWKDEYENLKEKVKEYEEDFFRAVAENDLTRVESLLRLGVDPNVKGVNNETALMIASQRGYIDIVNLLLEEGADVNEQMHNKVTALMLATADSHNPELARVLLQAGAEVNHQDIYGYTPLIYTSALGYIEMVKVLLEEGANVNAKNRDRMSALMFASDKGHEDIVKELLAAGAEVNARDRQGNTSLMLASDKGHEDIVEELLAAGAYIDDQNYEDRDNALLLALKKYKLGVENLPTIFSIIKYKPDPDIMNTRGETPLVLAKELGLDSVVDALMYLNREKRAL